MVNKTLDIFKAWDSLSPNIGDKQGNSRAVLDVWKKNQPRYLLFWSGLDKCQVPTKTALSLPLLNWTGRENMMKGSRVKTRTGRDHSPITVMGKTG